MERQGKQAVSREIDVDMQDVEGKPGNQRLVSVPQFLIERARIHRTTTLACRSENSIRKETLRQAREEMGRDSCAGALALSETWHQIKETRKMDFGTPTGVRQPGREELS